MRASILMALALVLTAACNDDSNGNGTDSSMTWNGPPQKVDQQGTLAVNETITRFSIERWRDSDGKGKTPETLLWVNLAIERPEGEVDDLADGVYWNGFESRWQSPDRNDFWHVEDDRTEALLWAYSWIDQWVPVSNHAGRLEHESGDIAEGRFDLTVAEGSTGEYFYNPYTFNDTDGNGIAALGFVSVEIESITDDQLAMEVSYDDERIAGFWVKFWHHSGAEWDEGWTFLKEAWIEATANNNSPDGQGTIVILSRGTDDFFENEETDLELSDATHFSVIAFGETVIQDRLEEDWISSFDLDIPMPSGL